MSGDLIKDQVTAGLTVFYSPEYTGKTGEVWTVEGSLSVALPKIGAASPGFSALVGYQAGDQAGWQALFANGDSSYVYWNAGVSLGFMDDKLSLDFRYWDTNVSDTNTVLATTNFCTGQVFRCNERFVFSATLGF